MQIFPATSNKGDVYKLVNNRTYLGEAMHKGKSYPGEHEGIVPRELWDRAHAILQESPRVRANRNRNQTPALLLRGLIFGVDGRAMSPTHTRRRGRLHRYYVSQDVLKGGGEVETRIALEQLDPLWDELFPAEQARIVRLLVERVEIGPSGADIRLRIGGLTSLVHDLGTATPERLSAAA